MKNEIAIVVPSCDKYSDLWKPLFENLRAKWPDNPYKIYLISNFADFNLENGEVIKVGIDTTWSANLKKALQSIKEKTVFLLIDDLFFKDSIDSNKVEHLFTRFNSENMNYLRLNPTPGPTGPLDKDGIGAIPSGDYYRSSTVVCLWNRQVLIEVLDEKETAWDFELVGSTRTDKYSDWYASSRWQMPTINLVIKGKYDPVAYKKLINEGLSLSDKRNKMTTYEYMNYEFQKFRSLSFTLIPRGLRRSIRNRFLKKI